MSDQSHESRGISRRSMLTFMGVGAVGIVGAAPALAAEHDHPPRGERPDRPDRGDRPARPDRAGNPGAMGSFYGDHQQGVITSAQAHLAFTALDVTAASRDELVGVLRGWTDAAAGLMESRRSDGLSLTFGFGPSLFTLDGVDRFGIAAQQPGRFTDLPVFPGDEVEAAISAGDFCIQACADDPQAVQQSMRELVRAAGGKTVTRWTQAGTVGASGRGAPTPRNLFGFKDGTANIPPNDTLEHNDYVWVQPGDGPDWMAGGTYLAARKIAMHLDMWDDEPVGAQEQVFGRTKGEGAPLSGGTERTRPDFRASDASGARLINPHSHLALAHSVNRQRIRILRRGYNYIEGTRPDGSPDAGLFFIAFNRDPQTQFIPMQRQLSESDLMNRFVSYRSSSAFAIPPGVRSAGGFIGEGVLGG